MHMEDNRIPAIDKNNGRFTIVSKSGSMSVDLIEVIGRGGSCLAYKAEKKTAEGMTRAVVVKEYYPQEDSVLHGISYSREAVGGEISLKPVDKMSVEEVQRRIGEEKERQKANVAREIELTRQLAYNPEHVENNPFCFNAERLGTRGDSTYILIDTNKGCTLRRLLKNKGGKIGIQKAIDYTKELLYVAEKMLFEPENSFCHADIKPENIYLAGMESDKSDALNNGVPRIMLLDFGSVFNPQNYQLAIDNEEEISEEVVMEKADEILYNEGIGCSSEGYRSRLIQDVYIKKSDYRVLREFEYARRLVDSINRIDNSVDIFSIVQCFFEMAIGALYPVDKKPRKKTFEKEYGVDPAVANHMIKIGENNRLGYKTTAEINADLDELSAILNRDAIPQVLLSGVNSKFKGEYENSKIDEGLFGNISFE